MQTKINKLRECEHPSYNRQVDCAYCRKIQPEEQKILQIQANTEKIIQEAKDRGYVPEKKENPKTKCVNAENQLFGSCFSCEKNNGFNQAIDSYNLEKIVELAYERGKWDVVLWKYEANENYL